jgi:2-C-methyl-D-erythritol 4-phosphate cytidylyltransferase
MFRDKHFTAIVLAAGKGSRMKSDVPKQYMLINDKEVIYYSLKAFQDSDVDDIILVTREEDIEICRKDIVEKYHINKVKEIIAGGTERYWSVKNGLDAAVGTDYVLIHDGARPCLDNDMITRLMEDVLVSGACSLGVPAKDTIKVVDDEDYGIDTPDRQYLWQVQTPQAFIYEDLIHAYQEMEKENNINVTDDTMIIERYLGRKSKMVFGSYSNIKITTPEDIFITKIFLDKT